jgi:cytosine/adenosine deaminase-related metal-dependent hydrolase
MSNQRLLIRNGHVLSMDPAIGDLERGSVLIEDGRIAAVGPDMDGVDAEVIDARGGVIMPGFVDTHRHTWQTALRALCADWTLWDYVVGIRMTLSPRYAASDVYVGNYAGALEAIDAGVTTILDFSHCNNTPEHADAAVQGLRESGLRAVFAYGYFAPPRPDPHFTAHEQRLADSRRVAEALSGSGLVTMGISLTEPGMIPFTEMRAEVETARDLGVVMATHTGCVWGAPTGLAEFAHHGLLGPDMVHVHCNTCSEAEWELLRRSDAKISTSPETEISMGMGRPVIRRALDLGLVASLSCDVMSMNSGDMFTQMRVGLEFERCMHNDTYNMRGENPPSLDLRARDALEWGTVNGAKALGMDDRIGSLTPGKRADVIVVGEGDRLNMIAPADRAGAVVLQANPANVETVVIDGTVRKRDGVLVDVDLGRVRRLVEESRDAVLGRTLAAGPLLPEPRGGWHDIHPLITANLAGAHAGSVTG